MMLLFLAFACDTPPATSDDTDSENTDDTGLGDTAERCDGVDENCDGSIDEGSASVALLLQGPGDGSVSSAVWYGYDADDNQVLYGRDPEQDGALNNYLRYEWVNGYLFAEERSDDGTTVVSRAEFERDADGNLREVRYDNGDGIWDQSYGYVYTDGLVTGFWYDYENDGVYDQTQGYAYNEYSLLTHYWSDDDGDGVYDVEYIYTYDADHLVSAALDYDGDGVFETQQTNTWEGDQLVEELATGGSYPYRRTYTFTDADDYWDASDYDTADDGSIDYRYTQTVDAEGTITAQTFDQFADGVDVVAYTYEVDADGNIRNTSYLDGELTSVYEYEYDSDGTLRFIRQDSNGDGAWEGIYEYDAFAHLIYQMYQDPSDGVIDAIQQSLYDERGRRLGQTIDTLGDGVLEYEEWPRDGYVRGSM